MTGVAEAYAPSSVANVAVGFDILGHTIDGPRDRALVRRIAEPRVRIVAIRGIVTDLPSEAGRNSAGRALESLHAALGLEFGFEIELEKGIPLGSGLGGSAASAVAALVAANALLDRPLAREALYPHALEGEAVAAGSRHGDNVGPQLLGGLVLAARGRLVPIPVPAGLLAVVVHPHVVLETRRARAALAEPFPVSTFVAQSEGLALVLAGCHTGRIDLLRSGLRDELVEPRRAALIPGFADVRRAALDAEAIGAGISGAGPSVFAWFDDATAAAGAAIAMRAAFRSAGLASDAFVSRVDGPRAELLRCAT